MKRRTMLAGGSTLMTAALAGCIASAQSDGEPTDHSERDRTISVRKQGQVAAEPDLAVVRTSIEVTGDTAAAVRDELSERADELRAGLLDTGVDDDQISTDRFRVRDRIDRRRAEAADVDSRGDLEQFTYYEGTHRFRVEVQDVNAVGSVVDTAIDSGADSVGRIEFTLSKDKRAELREQALESALDEARREADFVASEVDATVVDVQAIDTSEGRVSTVRTEAYAVAEDAADDTASTEIGTDDVTVRATAAVRYRIS